jgi:CRISPR/Cas system-associated endonuclease Cas1
MPTCEVRLEVQTPKLNNATSAFTLQGSEAKCTTAYYSALFSQSATTNENPQYRLCHAEPDSWLVPVS